MNKSRILRRNDGQKIFLGKADHALLAALRITRQRYPFSLYTEAVLQKGYFAFPVAEKYP